MSMTDEGPSLIRKAVAGEVLALMGRYRVSQERLARHLGMSQPSLSKRLHGVVPWDVDELVAVARYFGKPARELLPPDEHPKRRATDLASVETPGQMELAWSDRPSLKVAGSA